MEFDKPVVFEVSISTVSHNSLGGGCFSLLARIINKDAPNFGSAVQKFNIQPHFDDLENCVPGGQLTFSSYKENLKKLPTFTFSRVNHNLTMKYLSKVCLGIDFRRKAAIRDAGSLIENESAILLQAFHFELIVVLDELKKHIKPADDFDLPAFLAWVSSRKDFLPKSNEEAYQLFHYRDAVVQPDITAIERNYVSAMTLNEFWNIIDLISVDALNREDQRRALKALVSCLELESVDKIRSFYNHLANVLYDLDTRNHCEATREFQSDDSWLYLRCYVVARGYKYYHNVLTNSSAMPKEYRSGELLLHVAPEAWAKVTKDEPSNFDVGCAEKGFGSFANQLGWAE